MKLIKTFHTYSHIKIPVTEIGPEYDGSTITTTKRKNGIYISLALNKKMILASDLIGRRLIF